MRLLYASIHQHIGMVRGTLLNADTGQLLCRTVPVYGSSDTAHDEEGYAVGNLPCLWDAGQDASLPPPPVIPLNATLMSIAEYNSSTRHYGVMSLWEMRGGWVPKSSRPMFHV